MSILYLLAKNNILWSGSTICHFQLYISWDSTLYSTHARIMKFRKISDSDTTTSCTLVHDVTYTDRYVRVVHLCFWGQVYPPFFIGSHLPRPRRHCRLRTRKGGYCLRIQKSFKKSMWVLTSEIEFLFIPLYHRRAKKRCSFKTQTRKSMDSMCVWESFDWSL